MRNSFVIKLILIFLSCIAAVILATYVVKLARNSNSLTYDLGSKVTDYEDTFLKNFSDYENLVKKYNIKKDLTNSNFTNSYYLASFQDYDSCSESKYKLVSSVKLEDTLNITYEVFNKCGWCKKHIILYLIEINKYEGEDPVINYSYNYQNEINCGDI